MKSILVLSLAILLGPVSSPAQTGELKGSVQCSKKKSSKEYPPFLDASPNTPRHSFNVLNYKLNLDIRSCFLTPYPKTYAASNEVRFRVDTALSSIALNAVNSSLTIDSVRLAGTSFVHSSNILTISLDRTYAPGETTSVKIYYRHNNVSDNAFYVSNGMVFTDCEPEGARSWFPCWDKPSDKATVDLTARTPASVKLGSNGRLADSTTAGDTTWFHWVSRDPVSTYLVVMTGKVNYNLDIVYWHPPAHPADSVPVRFYWNTGESVTHSKQTIISMMTHYSDLFGEHPFEKNGFATIAPGAGFAWGGMENQTLTSFCPGCWGDNLMSHEFAHQWFGDMITCGTWADVWQNEGFATYCEALWYEYTGGSASYKNDILNDANEYLSTNPGWPIYNPSWAIATPPTGTLFNTAITYDKGACVLHMLRYTLGDSLFFAVLKAYATDAVNFKYGNVVTADFVTKVSEAAGQDMSWFFTWLYQPNHPVYGNTYNITSLGGGQWMVGFKASQTQTNAGFFPMPLTLQMTFSSGPDSVFRVMNNTNNQVFAFRFGRQPVSVTFDPNNDIVLKEGGTFAGATLTAPTLVAPAPNAVDQSLTPSLVWNPVITSAAYLLQVALDSTFQAVVLDDSTITDTVRLAGPLLPSTSYFWRVRGRNAGGAGPFSAVRRFRTTLFETNTYAYADGWNLVSVPLIVSDARRTSLFPSAVSDAFAYDSTSGYVRKDTLLQGTGYWLRFNGPHGVPIGGYPVSLDTVVLSSGWNLIGAISGPVPASSVGQVPPGILASPFYGFSGSYSRADTLRPGGGYWVKASSAGRVVLTTAVRRQAAPVRGKKGISLSRHVPEPGPR